MSNIFGGGGGGGGAMANANIVQTLVQTVKQDMEQLEKGHQWPFSCYSPAKDCISIPGIDDISPEELRFDAYQAIANGTVAAYQQKCQETTNKYTGMRQMLANPSNEMREIFRKIYNKESLDGISSVPSGAFGASSGSLFGGSAMSSSGSIFGGTGSSLFSSNSNTTTANTSGSIFGGNVSSNLFGARAPAAASGSTSIFGGSTGGGANLFGALSNQPTASSIFGGGGSSLFGAPATQSVFGTPAQQQQSVFGGNAQQPQSGSTLFGAGNTSAGIFGQKRTATPFGVVPGATQPTSLFGQPSAQTGSSIFGQPQQQQQNASQTSIFGQQAAPQSSIFGQQQPTASSIFGSPSQTQPVPMFGQPAQMPAFGGQPQQQQSTPFQTQSVFGTPNIQQQQQPQQQTSGIFGGQQQQQPISIFGSPPQQQQQSFSSATFGENAQQTQFGVPTQLGNIFGNRTENDPGTTASLFGARPAGAGGAGLFGEVIEPQHDSSVYTALENLSQDILDIFRRGKFELGKIPEIPPPQELCV